MKTILMFKMPFESNHFHKNQKVWIRRGTGALAAEVRGRFKGRGKYVTVWVSWEKKTLPPPEIKKFEVDDNFYEKIRGDCECDEWYDQLNL